MAHNSTSVIKGVALRLIMERETLTPRQEAFCQFRASGHSKVEAYRAAYGQPEGVDWVYQAADVLSRNPIILRRIIALQVEAAKHMTVTREWLLSWLMKRIVYDPAELTRWLQVPCRRCHGEGHGYQWREFEFMDALNEATISKLPMPDLAGGFGYDTRKRPVATCPGCDGKGEGRSDFIDTRDLSDSAAAAFEGVKQTANGLEIKMADKMAAMTAYAKLAGMEVTQIRHMTERIPTGPEMEALARDPIAAAASYKLWLSGGVPAGGEISDATH